MNRAGLEFRCRFFSAGAGVKGDEFHRGRIRHSSMCSARGFWFRAMIVKNHRICGGGCP